jgi:hypothetical protein
MGSFYDQGPEHDPGRHRLKLTRRSCVDEGAVREVKPRKSAGLSRRERRGSASEQGGSRRAEAPV